MRTCHFQDRPGKRSICLRPLQTAEGHLVEDVRWKLCSGGDECPHCGWDHERRIGITRARNALLGSCGACGRSHDGIGDWLECLYEARVRSVLLDTRRPSGSTEPLLDAWFPKNLKDKAWRAARKAVVDRDGHVCQECGRDLKEYPSWYTEVHHIIAVIDGGSDHPSNLVTLCVECHGAHTDDMCRKTPFDRREAGRGSSHRRKRTVSQSVLDQSP